MHAHFRVYFLKFLAFVLVENGHLIGPKRSSCVFCFVFSLFKPILFAFILTYYIRAICVVSLLSLFDYLFAIFFPPSTVDFSFSEIYYE